MQQQCCVCSRPLRNPASIKAGMGPVCAGKAPKDVPEQLRLLSEPFEQHGLVCRRQPDGSVAVNIARRHTYHSPNGFEWGYGGSGPADLALNVLALLLPAKDDGTDENLPDGTKVSRAAMRLHQDFKWHFISGLPAAGGRVPLVAMQAWVQARIGAE